MSASVIICIWCRVCLELWVGGFETLIFQACGVCICGRGAALHDGTALFPGQQHLLRVHGAPSTEHKCHTLNYWRWFKEIPAMHCQIRWAVNEWWSGSEGSTHLSLLTDGAFFQLGWSSCSELNTWPFFTAKPRRQYMETAFWLNKTREHTLHETLHSWIIL